MTLARFAPALLVPVLASTLLLSGCSGESPSDVAFGNKVREYLLRHPEVLVEAANALQAQETAKAAEQAKKALVDYRKDIERDPRDFVANPNGKITVTEFFDYRCGYCKSAAPEIIKLIAANPDVRFVFKEYPIFGGDSETAARTAIAVHSSGGKYLSLYNEFLAAKQLDKPAMDQLVRAQGLDPATIDKVAASAETSKHVADVEKLAKNLGIAGTPAFIIGDEVISGADLDAVQSAINRERKA